jgi:hypothetical protein
MIYVGVKLDIKIVMGVFECAITELGLDLKRLVSEEENENSVKEIYQINIHTCLYLLVIAQKSEKIQEDLISTDLLKQKFCFSDVILMHGTTSRYIFQIKHCRHKLPHGILMHGVLQDYLDLVSFLVLSMTACE